MSTQVQQRQAQFRLDAAESVFFKRETEYVDRQAVETLFPENLSRLYVPTQSGIPDWANAYTWQTITRYGRAKIIGANADDLPRANVSGGEESKIIKDVGASYAWTIKEIKRAAATGMHIDAMRAMAARAAIDTEIDRILAVGDEEHGMEGLANLTGVALVAPIAKTGGGTAWSDAATADQIAGDLFKVVTEIVTGLKGAGVPMFRRYTILLPIAKHAYISQRRMGDGSDKTILKFVLENSPFIEAIEPWEHLDGAGAAVPGTTQRLIAYVRNPLVVSGIVPQEFTPLEPEKRNLEYVVDCTASTGGVVVRYPIAMRYMDGI